MPCILLIESSTTVCSVALSHNGEVVFNRENHQGLSHTTLLAPFADEAVQCARDRGIELDAVAVSCGPGSYTGLRIGVSLAKGICYGSRAKLIAVNTLELLAHTLGLQYPDRWLCPMIDARRMEVYSAIYGFNGQIIKPVSADIITSESYGQWLSQYPIVFGGNGAEKCQQVLTHPNALFVDHIVPLACQMESLALRKWEEGITENTAYFEPFYLKEFIATVSKNKVING